MQSTNHDSETLPVQSEQAPTKSSVEMLAPHLVAMTFILLTIMVTVPVFWNTAVAIVDATVGPVLFSVSLAMAVCGMIAYPVLSWLCARGTRAYRRSIIKQARRAERAKRRRAA